jgi:hypothetical protein
MQDIIETMQSVRVFWIFYVIGGVIGILINLRFLLPTAYFDVTQAWDFPRALQTIGYHLIRIVVISCVVFFVSWISVGFFLIYYDHLKSNYERMKL